MKKAIFLINIGTPDSTSTSDVRKYLSEFLNDKRVIDLPYLMRKILVNLIIVPFRSPKSAKEYEKLWDEKGSPLLYHTNSLRDKLNSKLNSEIEVFTAMRYRNPNLKAVLNEININKYDELIFVPMYPQYASSTTGSTVEYIFDCLKGKTIIPKVRTIEQFYDNREYINSFVKQIKKFDLQSYDHIIFSYHGLPLSHIDAVHPSVNQSTCTCTLTMPEHGKYCYRATCYATTRLLADALDLREENYTVSFQSRLTKKWLEPFTDVTLIQKAKSGTKSILIVSPAFVTDCLETTVELGESYKELFIENGGEKLDLVPSLNDEDFWVDSLIKIIQP